MFNPIGPLAKVVPSLSIIAACILANEALETTNTDDYKAAYEAHIYVQFTPEEK